MPLPNGSWHSADLLGKKLRAFAGRVGGLVLVDELGARLVEATHEALLPLERTDHQRFELPVKSKFLCN